MTKIFKRTAPKELRKNHLKIKKDAVRIYKAVGNFRKNKYKKYGDFTGFSLYFFRFYEINTTYFGNEMI